MKNLPIFLVKKLEKVAAQNGRTVHEQILFFVEQGVKHLSKQVV